MKRLWASLPPENIWQILWAFIVKLWLLTLTLTLHRLNVMESQGVTPSSPPETPSVWISRSHDRSVPVPQSIELLGFQSPWCLVLFSPLSRPQTRVTTLPWQQLYWHFSARCALKWFKSGNVSMFHLIVAKRANTAGCWAVETKMLIQD